MKAGGCDMTSSNMIRSIAKSVASRWNARWQMIEHRMKQELSSTVVQGTARMVMRRKVGGGSGE